MSYRKKHVKSNVHRIKPKKSIFRKLWFWVLVLIIIIILLAGYFVLFYSGIQVKSVIISGNERVAMQDLQNVISPHESIVLFSFLDAKVTSKSIFLIDKNDIIKDVQEKFPEIEKLAVKKNLPQTLTITVTERKPLGVLCDSNKCFFIDQGGTIFEPMDKPSTGMTIVRQVEANQPLFAGQRAVDRKIMDYIYLIQEGLKDNSQLDVKEAIIISSARLNITTSEGWKAYFDLDDDSDIDSQITKLNLLLSGEISAESKKNLRYIDLRPKDRAIVCDNATCGG